MQMSYESRKARAVENFLFGMQYLREDDSSAAIWIALRLFNLEGGTNQRKTLLITSDGTRRVSRREIRWATQPWAD